MKKIIFLSALCALVAFFSCKQGGKENKSSATSRDDSLITLVKSVFKTIPNVPDYKNDPVLKAKVELGKMLFYDIRLSKKGNVSCNSCHNLNTFGNDNLPNSPGDDGKHGTRNSPTVFNAALQNMQFWDGRAKDVEQQAGMPIMNPIEMGIPHKGFLIDRLSGIKMYRQMFKTAFPSEKQAISYENLGKAIGAFERTLLTPSRFDKFMQGDKNALTDQEKSGLVSFMNSGCASCHNGVGIGGGSLQKFGIVTDYRTLTHSKTKDEGRKAVTKKNTDKDMFKVAALRNVQGTYPYFHDGSIANLDSAITIMGKVQLNKNLSEDEVSNIKAFLKSLTGDVSAEAKTIPAGLQQDKKKMK
ncbi:MAG: cytochrome-c peroxidase [Flavisolibacter sp.]